LKAKVLRKFKDKHTKKICKKGEIIEVNKERFEEINSTSHGVLVEEVEGSVNYEEMTKKEIVKHAKEKGIELNMRMTKEEMVKELM